MKIQPDDIHVCSQFIYFLRKLAIRNGMRDSKLLFREIGSASLVNLLTTMAAIYPRLAPEVADVLGWMGGKRARRVVKQMATDNANRMLAASAVNGLNHVSSRLPEDIPFLIKLFEKSRHTVVRQDCLNGIAARLSDLSMLLIDRPPTRVSQKKGNYYSTYIRLPPRRTMLKLRGTLRAASRSKRPEIRAAAAEVEALIGVVDDLRHKGDQ